MADPYLMSRNCVLGMIHSEMLAEEGLDIVTSELLQIAVHSLEWLVDMTQRVEVEAVGGRE